MMAKNTFGIPGIGRKVALIYIPAIISTLLCISCAIFFQQITALNTGIFSYTLDDPYIHLALAENILHGHYGVNAGEYSSPSSSILWPFLLSPFTVFDNAAYIPLLANILFTIGSIVIISRILEEHFVTPSLLKKTGMMFFFTGLYLASTNALVLIFNGMEHSLQVFLGVLVFWQLVKFTKTGHINPLFSVAVIAAPLFRYENLSISLTAILIIFLYGQKREAIFLGIATLLPVLLFSGFLKSLGLGILPSSVITKTAGGNPTLDEWLLRNIVKSLLVPSGHFFILAILFFCGCTLLLKKRLQVYLLLCFCLPPLLHLVIGKYDWFLRYEMYVISWCMLGMFYTLVLLKNTVDKNARNPVLIGLFSFLFIIAGSQILSKNINATINIPLLSNYMFSQPYQMHKIASHFGGATGVNDLGYVSFKNDNYVLDFWGLASEEARIKRFESGENSQWMDILAKKHDVKLVMVTETWFPSLPPTWTKVAYLCLSKPTPTSNACVVILATDKHAVHDVYNAIKSIEASLPETSRLVWNMRNPD